jgi:hypothetical protein
MRVRIIQAPLETDVDGVKLDALTPGVTGEFSPSVGSWLIAKGYGQPEMRSPARDRYIDSGADVPRDSADHRPSRRRRRDD